ncbi:MAG: pilus assembly protein [Planctomycetaceae bacterium]|nr:pilus assembly protein [Planctomycetaceae bacterium]
MSRRRGALTVEMALVTPVLFLLLFATVEFSRVNMVRNTVKNACFEGARRSSLPGATADDVRAVTEKLLTDVGVKKATVEVFPSVIDNSTKSVIVHVSAPLNANAWVSPHFFKNAVIERTCRLNREYINPADADKPDPLDKMELSLIPNEVSELDELLASGGITGADLLAATTSTASGAAGTVGSTVAGVTGTTGSTSVSGSSAGSVTGSSGSGSTSGSGSGTAGGSSSTATSSGASSSSSSGSTASGGGTSGSGTSGTGSSGGGSSGASGGGSGTAVAGTGSGSIGTGTTGSAGGTAGSTSSGSTSSGSSSASGSSGKTTGSSLFDLMKRAREERESRDRDRYRRGR